jgi:hypothetical protein
MSLAGTAPPAQRPVVTPATFPNEVQLCVLGPSAVCVLLLSNTDGPDWGTGPTLPGSMPA